MPDVFGLPRRSHRNRWLAFALVLFAILLTAGAAYGLWQAWGAKGQLAPRGGLPFPGRLDFDVPIFAQNDPQWAKEPLGPTENTLGAEGCAVASAAMVLASYGIDTDPKQLNEFLTEKKGYTPEGWIFWEKAAELAPDKVQHVYEDEASYRLIDTNLLRGNPVIVRLRARDGTTHFVVIAGKDGLTYLIRDPGDGAAKGLYPLHEFGSKIEALRFYKKLE
jgi:hypothetical protein